MTFIAGYIYKDTVNIVADSAETYENIQLSPLTLVDTYLSSFQEMPHYDNGVFITENAQKIYNIDNEIIITFAGGVREGREVVNDIMLHYRHCDLLSNFLNQYFGGNVFPNNHFIIGFYENGVPHLFHAYNDGTFKLHNQSPTAVIGGVHTQGIYRTVPPSIEFALHQNYEPDELLIQILSTLQVLTISFQTIRSGVGGHFNGVYISKSGITWAADTYHLLYSNVDFTNGEKHAVMRCNRDNATFVISDFNKRLFRSDLERRSHDELVQTWGSKIEDLAHEIEAKFYVMLSYDGGNVVIINNDPNKENRIRIENGGIILNDLMTSWVLNERQPHKELGGVLPFNIFNNF